MKTPGTMAPKYFRCLLLFRLTAGVLAAAFALSLSAAEPASPPAPATARPNVLIVLIDDCPFNFLDVYQRSHVHTPNIKRLVDRGSQLLLPLQIAKSFGRFNVNADGGYIIKQHGLDELSFGLAAGYQATNTSIAVARRAGSRVASAAL